MTLRSLLSAVVVTGLPILEGAELPPAGPADPATPPWLAFDLSAEQLEADYQRTLDAGRSAKTEEWVRRAVLRPTVMIPVLFQADAGQDDEPAPQDRETSAVEELPAEGEPAAEEAEGVLPPNEGAVLEERMRELQRENEELRARLSQWEAVQEPVEPFIDPDWPAQEAAPRKRYVFRPRPARPPALEPKARPAIYSRGQEMLPFRPFTSAAMSLPRSGWTPRDRARSLAEQQQFFLNATKALGAGLRSGQFRGVRLEVEKAVLRGELNPRYAAQYLADIVDVFRTYERLRRFGLTGPVDPPLRPDTFRQDPNRMFRWASEVNEQKRRMSVE